MTRQKRRKSSIFPETLLKIRTERGGGSARAFFAGSGGKRKLGITYHYYLLIEQGLRLPSPRVLSALLVALGLEARAHQGQRKELLTAFVKALCGEDPVFDPVFEATQARPAREPGDLLQDVAIRKIRSVPRMSEEEYETVNSNPAALWAFEWLLQTGLSRTLSELAKDLGCPASELQFALELLVARKLVQRKKNGEYFCKRSATDLFGPTSGQSAGRASWIAEQVSKKTATASVPFYYPHFFLAVKDLAELAPAIEAFNLAMRKAYLLRTATPLKAARLVSVECRISPLGVSKER